MASSMPANIEEDRVSAMSAAMLSLGERIASELGRGSLDQVYVKGQHGYVILMSVGDEAVLTVLAREQAEVLAEYRLISRVGHLQPPWQVHPQLNPV